MSISFSPVSIQATHGFAGFYTHWASTKGLRKKGIIAEVIDSLAQKNDYWDSAEYALYCHTM